MVIGVDWLAEQLGKRVNAFAVLVLLIMTLQVILRYVFNRPTMWSYEVSYMMTGTFFVLVTPWVLLHKGHIRVDIFYARFSQRLKNIIDVVFIPLVCIPPMAVIALHAWKYAFNSLAQGEVSLTGIWEPTLVPFRFVVAVGFSLLSLEGVAWFIRELFSLTTGKDLITSKEKGDESND